VNPIACTENQEMWIHGAVEMLLILNFLFFLFFFSFLPILSPGSQCFVLSPSNIFQVIDYLAKKGYTRTEAMLRMESASQEIDGRPLPQLGEDARPKYKTGFGEQIDRHLKTQYLSG
jgi:hypothetical protein